MLEGYYKIIRDKTLKELQNKYELVLYKKLNNQDFKHYLLLRLKEETCKLLNANNKKRLIDKLADILEVIDYILVQENISKIKIKKIQDLWKKEKGGFDKKYLLISIKK